MAELDIGKHCNIKSCNQTDFLPFICDACRGVFCLEHRSRDLHSCPVVDVKKAVQMSGGSTSYPCTFEECKGKELLPVICPHCQKHFCLAHRHQDDHKCEKLETPKPRMAATQELVQKIVESKKALPPRKGRKGAKNAATAAKVALMKLKLHAAGDKGLPQGGIYTTSQKFGNTYSFTDREDLFQCLPSQRGQRLQPAHVFLFQVECGESSGLRCLTGQPQEQQQRTNG
ncbi:AN1-type zinc finger protein 1 isoform X2 [Coregonus clupeaformis]|uniref:AN1-type zinc finger protein 1 isoform X2 n=1 Tax=Coregonus clupeaformis TaxID=59861 RepID=UPI001BDFCBF9|nr:AN1-type zinc finger protein 1 isoform X2 [Coregonus clupeaformis]